MDNFSEAYLRKAIAGETQGDFSPFNKNDLGKTKRYVKGMLGRLADNYKLVIEPDYNSYGSGFASYINVKITKKDKSDTITYREKNKISETKKGLIIYISLVVPYWVYGGMEWTQNYIDLTYQGGTMPFLKPENIEHCDKELWRADVEKINQLFNEYRFSLLTKKELEKSLWFDSDIPTILADKPYQVFDCFFYWED